MNKNFPDADDDSLITKQPFGEPAADKNEFKKFAAPFSEIENEANLLEIPELKADGAPVSESPKIAAESANPEASSQMPADESTVQTTNRALSAETESEAANAETPGAKSVQTKADDYEIFSQSAYQTESSDETIRKSGLAYSAAIILFGSIVFTLILGWFADLLFGTAPWGKVGGIVLGAVIGFIQFFRTTSQILKNRE